MVGTSPKRLDGGGWILQTVICILENLPNKEPVSVATRIRLKQHTRTPASGNNGRVACQDWNGGCARQLAPEDDHIPLVQRETCRRISHFSLRLTGQTQRISVCLAELCCRKRPESSLRFFVVAGNEDVGLQ